MIAAAPPPELRDLGLDVSRETEARLAAYVDLLGRWGRRINLIGRSTLDDIWARHVWDSAQLLPLMRAAGDLDAEGLAVGRGLGPPGLVDLGSGAGFPGLVLGILGVHPLHLVEANGKKAAFLREALRVTGTDGTVHESRIEALPALPVAIVTARALASLENLLRLADIWIAGGAVCWFPKGARVEQELTAIPKDGRLGLTRHPSRSAAQGEILRLWATAKQAGETGNG